MTGITDVVVPAFPRPLPTLDVDVEQVADYGADLLAASSQVDDVGEHAAGPGRIDSWTGDGADTYRAELTPYGSRADALSLALRGVARRVDAHAEAMTRLRHDRADLEHEGRRISEEIFDLEHELSDYRATVAVGGFGEAVQAQRLTALRTTATTLALRVRDVDGRSLAWAGQVAAEEQAMIEAFERVIDVEQAERHYGDVDDPADAAVARIPDADASAAEVTRWWEGLDAAEQAAVIAAAPGAIGNRDGVPAWARDAANRNRLERDLARLRMLAERGELSDEEAVQLEHAEAAAEALERYDGRADPAGRPVAAQLWLYDPLAFAQDDGSIDGAVAISIGDPDTADNIAVNVAGLDSDAGDVGAYTDRAWYLHQSATTADPSQSYASIAYLGYDAPGTPVEAATEALAEAGAGRLADALDGLVATRDDDPRIVPIGHSYGSTALGLALSGHPVDVDGAAVVGSPGLGGDVHDVDDLDVPPGEFYVGRNYDDPVAGLGQNGSFGLSTLGGLGLGQDPADGDVGATRFQANAPEGADDHSSYYAPDSESLHNLGLILAGEEPTSAGLVDDPWHSPATDPETRAPSDRFDTDGDGDTDGVDGGEP